MKHLILFLFIHGCCSGISFAQNCQNFIAESEIEKAINLEPNAGAKRCGGDDPCICFDGIDWETAVYADVTEDDLTKPKYKAAYNVVSCADKNQSECAQMAEHEEFCIEGDQGYVREEGGVLEAYCTGLVGYEQKVVGKRLQEDPAKKIAKDQKVNQKAQRDALIAEGLKRQAAGNRIIALITANNDSRDLTSEQRLQIAEAMKPIIDLLQIGSIQAAKAKVQELTPDGVLVRQEDISLGLSAFEAEGF